MDQLRLCLVTDRRLHPGRDLVDVVGECAAAGLPAVQLREKDLGALELSRLGRRLRAVMPAGERLLVVNDRVDVALACGADGVQRTHSSLPVMDIRAIVEKRLLIVASVHSLEQAIEAEQSGADWLVFGPVYDTASKRAYGPPQGVPALERVVQAVTIPVVAIGGVTPERVVEVCAAGARGVAAIGAILGAPSPAGATRRFLEALERAGP